MSTKKYPKKQEDEVAGNIGIYDDEEVNLLDYLTVIWNRKWFILIATALPTLVMGVLLSLSPRTYTTTFVYDVRDDVTDLRDDSINEPQVQPGFWNLTQKNFEVMLNRFYSRENLNNLANKFEKSGLSAYANKARNCYAGSETLVEFKTAPAYINISKLKVSDHTDLQEFIEMEASMLRVTITGNANEDMAKISGIIRNNIENVISLYTIQDQLQAEIRSLKNNQSQIETSRYIARLLLDQNRKVITGLKNIKPVPVDNSETNVTLQYNIAGQTEYLPLSYQIHAAESKIINLEQEVLTTESRYKYYTELINLNQKLLAKLSGQITGDYSIGKFWDFVQGIALETEKPELKDFLNSYAKEIENRISASEPVSSTPRVYPIARGSIKKILLVLMAATLVSVFASFLLEGKKDDPRSNLSVKIP